MDIEFRLNRLKAKEFGPRAFKLASARSLFLEYIKRISHFALCRIWGAIRKGEQKEKGTKVWICDRGAKILSSEDLANHLEKLQISGVRRLSILIGGPDGFSKKEIEEFTPDLRWSFGSMTLPHELAAVVASEQIYRAFTIIHKTPYHLGHL